MTQHATEAIVAANGTYTDNGTPRDATSLTPFIVVRNADEAIRFYEHVFGARLLDRTEMPGPDGAPRVAHAVLDFRHGLLQLGDALSEFHLVPPSDGDDVCYSLGYYCPDVDAVTDRAVTMGAILREPASTFVSGDRYASVRDPFGVRWSIMTRVEDLSPKRVSRRVADWARSLN